MYFLQNVFATILLTEPLLYIGTTLGNKKIHAINIQRGHAGRSITTDCVCSPDVIIQIPLYLCTICMRSDIATILSADEKFQ